MRAAEQLAAMPPLGDSANCHTLRASGITAYLLADLPADAGRWLDALPADQSGYELHSRSTGNDLWVVR